MWIWLLDINKGVEEKNGISSDALPESSFRIQNDIPNIIKI
jgi:hypothetical protein